MKRSAKRIDKELSTRSPRNDADEEGAIDDQEENEGKKIACGSGSSGSRMN